MNRLNLIIISIVVILLGGCTTTGNLFHRNQSTPVTINTVPNETRAKVQELLKAWPRGDKAQIIAELEKLGHQFSSPDGAWEVTINSAIALAYLETGDVENFKLAVRTLRNYMQPNKRLPRPTQYVIAVDDAMRGIPTDESILIEHRISGVAQALLGNQNTARR